MNLEWKKTALADLEKLEKPVQDHIIRRVLKAAENTDHYLERLVDLPFYKLRCGDWRVFIEWKQPENHLAVLRVLHRKNAYDRL